MSMVISEDSWIDESIGSLSMLSASPAKGKHSSNSKYNHIASSLIKEDFSIKEEDHESSIIDEMVSGD